MTRNPDRRRRNVLVAGLALGALAAAVGAGSIGWAIGRTTEETAAVTSVATATLTSTTTVAVPAQTQPERQQPAARPAADRAAYLAAGCAACHGQNAEGTAVGPALPGHTAEQVRQQVRSPLAQMPAYSREQVSDAQLDAIAAYVVRLKPATTHVEPVDLPELAATHHWMALSALAADDDRDALHHVGHIIQLVKGEHRQAMKRARALLRAGELHEAEHLIEEMLAGKAKPELGLARLHLRLALTAVDQHDRAEAVHHVRHFLESAKVSERAKGEAILAHLREGDLHGAEHGIADLLGIDRD